MNMQYIINFLILITAILMNSYILSYIKKSSDFPWRFYLVYILWIFNWNSHTCLIFLAVQYQNPVLIDGEGSTNFHVAETAWMKNEFCMSKPKSRLQNWTRELKKEKTNIEQSRSDERASNHSSPYTDRNVACGNVLIWELGI